MKYVDDLLHKIFNSQSSTYLLLLSPIFKNALYKVEDVFSNALVVRIIMTLIYIHNIIILVYLLCTGAYILWLNYYVAHA
jgi:hypothetical protein